MNGAKHIIAVNADADAPIFSLADLGVVGDVHQVVPKLIEALRSRG
jgi:electron transfer flavoprotein alpha subunit